MPHCKNELLSIAQRWHPVMVLQRSTPTVGTITTTQVAYMSRRKKIFQLFLIYVHPALVFAVLLAGPILILLVR